MTEVELEVVAILREPRLTPLVPTDGDSARCQIEVAGQHQAQGPLGDRPRRFVELNAPDVSFAFG